MSWKEILKQSKYPKEMDKHQFIYDEQKIHNYAQKLLKEKFPYNESNYAQTLVGYKKGDSFKLGEITFKIDEIDEDIAEERALPVFGIGGGMYNTGGMFFNNQNIGSWGVDLLPDKPKKDSIEYYVSLDAKENDLINTDAHIEEYSTLKELENRI